MLRLPDSRTLLAWMSSVGLAGCNLIFGIQDGTLDDGTGGGGAGASVTTSTNVGGQGQGGGSELCNGVSCDDGNPCTEDVCDAGACSHPADSSPDLQALQTSGDCLTVFCGAANPPEPEEVNDDLDAPPSDDNGCTLDACGLSAGGIFGPYPPAEVGEVCSINGGLGQCDGAGTCLPDGCVPSTLDPGAQIGADCGVFVMPGSSGSGTRASPMGDLSTAFVDVPLGKAVYICGTPTYPGSFELEPGTALFGGLDCGTWQHNANNEPLLTGATPGEATLKIKGVGNSVVEGIGIIAASAGALTDGTPSVALLIENADVTIRSCSLASSNGAPGRDAVFNTNTVAPGANGGAGGAGQCLLVVTPPANGGAFGNSMCSAAGGAGGAGAIASNVNGFNGQPGTGGNGGLGQNSTNSCLNGVSAATNGANGGAGPAGSGDGSLSVMFGFTPATTPPGLTGTAGGGGGGGGGARYIFGCGGSQLEREAGGGGGAAGGCGGLGGDGGMGGGASFVIVSLGAQITIADSSLIGGQAGQGGDGVRGQPGAGGGTGGSSSGTACVGGNGSNGGEGGPGSGGPGGPAAFVAWGGTNAPVFVGTTNSFTTPAAAPGGLGSANSISTVFSSPGVPGSVCRDLQYGASSTMCTP